MPFLCFDFRDNLSKVSGVYELFFLSSIPVLCICSQNNSSNFQKQDSKLHRVSILENPLH